MIMGWIPPLAIPCAFDCNSCECWHQDKARHKILNDQCQDVVADRLRAQFDRDERERAEQQQRAADAAAAEHRPVMPEQHRGKGPKAPQKRLKEVTYKPRWSDTKYIEGAYEKAAPHNKFWGDADQCCRVGKWGRIKKTMTKAEMPSDGPNGESISYADLRQDQPVFLVDVSGDGWSVVRFIPEGTMTRKFEDGSTEVDTLTPSAVFS